MKTDFFKKLLVAVLVMALATPMLNGIEAKAASKPTLSSTKMEIGIGSYGEEWGCSHKTNTKYKVSVENSKKGASYTFTSSNKKVVTIKKSGTVGYITGVKAGKATITVKQKMKGKTTTVGKCNVTVKNSSVVASIIAEEELGLGTDIEASASITEPICWIKNYNPAAKYTYSCNNSNFKMSHINLDIGNGYSCYGQKYTAKKPGTYTVTLKETYKKKTRTVGKFKVVIHDTIIRDTLDLFIGQTESLAGLIGYYNGYYRYETQNDAVLKIHNDGEYLYMEAIAAGTDEIKFYYYDKKTETVGDYIGSCKITITEPVVKDIEVNETLKTYAGNPDGYFYYEVITEPEEAAYYVPVKITSSDESVIKIIEDESGKYEAYSAVAEGTATVTITAGNVTKNIKVTVISEEEYFDEW